MKDELIRWREPGSDASDELREMFRAASNPPPPSEEEMAREEAIFLERIRVWRASAAAAEPAGATPAKPKTTPEVGTAPQELIRWREPGSDASDELREMFRAASNPPPPSEEEMAREEAIFLERIRARSAPPAMPAAAKPAEATPAEASPVGEAPATSEAMPRTRRANRRRVVAVVSGAIALAAGVALLRSTVLQPAIPVARTFGPDVLPRPRRQQPPMQDAAGETSAEPSAKPPR